MRINTAKKIIVKAIQNTKDRKDDQLPICPFLLGAMGIGKTYLVKQIAKELNMFLVTTNLAQYEPSDIGGMQMPDGESMKVLKPKWLLGADQREEKIADGFEGIMYFFDELPQAPILNMNIFATISDEYRVGEYKIPMGDVVLCAGNRMSDRSGTNQMPMHLKDRITTYEIEPNLDDVCNYFMANKKDHRIVSWLRFVPEFLHKFDRDANAFPTPRSHERVSDILKWDLDDDAMYHAVASQIGESASASLFTHLRIQDKCPNLDDIVKDPDSVSVPEDMAISFATTSGLVGKVNNDNMANILRYVSKMSGEFLACFVKDALAKNRDLLQNKALRYELSSNGKLKELVL